MPVTTSITSSGLTDSGHYREENQDCFLVEEELGLFAVLDGMGGHQGGATASNLARKTIAEYMQGNAEMAPRERLLNALTNANACVHKEAKRVSTLRGMGTTVVAALVCGEKVLLAHAGDSRAYLMRDSRLSRLTNDHTIVAELVASGIVTPTEAQNHPHKSVLSRNLGALAQTQIATSEIEFRTGDQILLCSDGLNGYASQGSIEQVLAGAETPSHAVRDLINLANQGGGGDNVTVVIIKRQAVARTDKLHDTGAAAWWKRKALFLQSCAALDLQRSTLAAMLPANEAMPILGGNFCEAMFHDLENATTIHVWTYADQLLRGWLGQGGDYGALEKLFNILRSASLSVAAAIQREQPDLGICLESAILRSMVVVELAAGEHLGGQIQQINERLASEAVGTHLPDTTFASSATIPFDSVDPIAPADSSLRECLEGGLSIALAALAHLDETFTIILQAAHAAAMDFGGEAPMWTIAKEIYGERLLAEQDIVPLFNTLEACRNTHLRAIGEQDASPKAKAKACRGLALAHHSLCHAFALISLDAGKPTADRLQEMIEATSQMRERFARNDAELAALAQASENKS